MTEHAPLPVIIDTDPGVDDVLALLLALASPDLLVLAITVTHGNTTLEWAERNLDKVFYALEKHIEQGGDEERKRWRGVVDRDWRTKHGASDKVKVLSGCAGPLEGKAVTAKYFHGKDGLADCATRHPELTPPPDHTSSLIDLSSSSAHDGILDLLSARPRSARKPSYVALGPLTSLAKLSQVIEVEESFEVVLSMGGSFIWGNTTPTAEFNYYADPFAARQLFSQSLSNLYLFPLDITSYLTLPFSLYASRVDPTFHSTRQPSQLAGPGSPAQGVKRELVHFTSSFLEGTKEVMEKFGGDSMELHDPTVVFALIEYARATRGRGHESERVESGEQQGRLANGWAWNRVDFEIECDGTLTRGMLIRDLRPSSQCSTSLTARTGQTNRTLAIEADDDADVDSSDTPQDLQARLNLDCDREQATAQLGKGSMDVVEAIAESVEGGAMEQSTSKRRRVEAESEAGDNAEKASKVKVKTSGARVVVTSPGSEKMRKEILSRVWGVDLA
ncbi:hypothetical protein JCM10212_004187 [Sporobolomyces blumeae]